MANTPEAPRQKFLFNTGDGDDNEPTPIPSSEPTLKAKEQLLLDFLNLLRHQAKRSEWENLPDQKNRNADLARADLQDNNSRPTKKNINVNHHPSSSLYASLLREDPATMSEERYRELQEEFNFFQDLFNHQRKKPRPR
ncbi:MAG: hypothetical protein U1C49_01665 [Candidatus Andersenbacteria bacterium]|nr:hypothetical protein [bacterium]MDZ4225533.1 hypothetical protein [Candidatus Andersenbacteria bacterium]